MAEAPREASTHGELGLVYEANNLWREAAAAYEIASGLDPSEPLWRLHWAIALSEEGETARGIEMLRAVASESPQLAAAHHRLGLALIETGEVPAAREHFSKLIALKPDAPERYVGSAGTRLRERDYAAASSLLDKALALDASYQEAHYLLGLAYRGLGLLEDAKVELAIGMGASSRTFPDALSDRIDAYAVNLPAQLAKAGRYLSLGRPDRAARTLESCLESHPGNLAVMNNLAIAYMRMGELERASSTRTKSRST